ncbi:pentatricopeptide repeat-containing protein At2g37320 [Punica granatum]|uniref:Uncharacterized protein n=2 Tax=Punica granatum TaxID=22663 RepID=A0A218W7B0_PUNGR|nr:pentatricopeptide repeat-containing protein At2g37320 [Punica granatum]OWM68767.1 hypothetical protein CDL15_Pgr024954 [Punica granatum]PKI66484.1 hypothetical protein CRG98_013140 [Punica granatum]
MKTLFPLNKPSFSVRHLQQLSPRSHLSSSSSSSKSTGPIRSSRVDKALRVLDLIARSPNVPTPRQSHLRLIQDFFRADPNARPRHTVPEPEFLAEAEPTSLPSHPRKEREAVDAIVLSRAVSSCGSTRDLFGGIQFHCLAVKTGFFGNSYVGSSLITLYSRCGELENAHKVLDEMSVKNVVSWTAMISGYAQGWQVNACLKLYGSMRISGSEPNDLTFVGLLAACMGSGALGQGRSVHCLTVRAGFNSHTHVANSLISMYCKCGDIKEALQVFRDMPSRDIVSWNSMIAGHAQFGQAVQANKLFEEMKQRNVKPDRITFLGILSSCRHAGLLELGRDYFNSMAMHGVEPELGHYSCIVDLLGRSRKLEEARSFIERMPISANGVIWGSLLSSCRVHGGVWIGIEAAESRLVLEPRCAATYVQLANLYASVGYWDEAARVRKFMKDRGLRTCPGYSWIEISKKVHRFRAEDVSNDSRVHILSILDCLLVHMRSFGYSPEVYEEDDDGILFRETI